MNKVWWIVLIVVVSLGGLFLLTPLGGNVGTFTQSALGFSTMSLSQVDLQSNYAPLNGQVWVMSFRLGGLSQSANFASDTVSPSDVSAFYSGASPRDSFKLDTSLDEQSCVYDISQDFDLPSINSYSVVSWSYNSLLKSCEGSKPVNVCGNAQEVVGWCYGGLTRTGVYICETKKAVAGRFGSPNVNSKFNISVSRNGVVDSSRSFQTLFSDGSSFGIDGLVGSNVYINWQGDLSSGKSCPSSSAVIPVYYLGSWTTMGSANYDSYKTQYLNLLSWTSGEGYKTASLADAQSRIGVVNSASNNALSGRSFGTIDSASTLSSARARVVLTSPISYPMITAYIKASWIGVVTPIGKPKIVDASTSCFASSADGSVKVTVQNVGSGREDFTIDGVCANNAFSIVGSDAFLNPSESKVVYLGLSGETSDSSLKSSCTINVSGKSYSDSKVVTACVNGLSICDAGKLYCDQNNLMKCNVGGTALAILQSCNDACIYNSSSGVAQCKTVVVDKCGNGICDATETKENCALDCQPACVSSLGGLVSRSVGVKESCNLWCSIGLKSPEKVNVCVTDYTPLTLAIIFVLALTAILIFGLRKGGKKKSGKSFLLSKWFWIVFAVIVAVVLLILYFKFVIWIAIGIIVALILDAIFLKSKIRKVVMKIFRW